MHLIHTIIEEAHWNLRHDEKKHVRSVIVPYGAAMATPKPGWEWDVREVSTHYYVTKIRYKYQYKRTKYKWCKEWSYQRNWDHKDVSQTQLEAVTPSVELLKPKTKIRVGSWNVRTLYQAGKLQEDGELQRRTSMREWGSLDRLGKGNSVHVIYHWLQAMAVAKLLVGPSMFCWFHRRGGDSSD